MTQLLELLIINFGFVLWRSIFTGLEKAAIYVINNYLQNLIK